MKQKILKSVRRKQKAVQKKSKFLLKHPLLMPTVIFLCMFFGGLILFVTMNATTEGPSDARIVNIYADNEQRTVTTRAKTVNELLDRLSIKLAAEDIVEPHREVPILEDNTQINVYRARPVQVVDGERILTLLTAQRAPRLVAHDAGLELYPEDKASFERIESNVLETSIKEQLAIKRSVEIQLNLYGVVKKVRTVSDTVSDALNEQGVNVKTLDGTIDPAVDTPIRAGILISVNRFGLKTVTVTEPIAFGTETANDDTIKAGDSQIQRTGENGERAVIYEIEEKDGVEIGRKELQIVILKEPVNEVKLRGTKIIAPSFNSSVTVSGDKAALMAAAGIPESDFGYVDYIISKESGWRPGAANPNGAYGLCQAYPGSKMASAGADYLTNPITQLQWCSGYASRYGGWAGAYAAWQAQGWW